MDVLAVVGRGTFMEWIACRSVSHQHSALQPMVGMPFGVAAERTGMPAGFYPCDTGSDQTVQSDQKGHFLQAQLLETLGQKGQDQVAMTECRIINSDFGLVGNIQSELLGQKSSGIRFHSSPIFGAAIPIRCRTQQACGITGAQCAYDGMVYSWFVLQNRQDRIILQRNPVFRQDISRVGQKSMFEQWISPGACHQHRAGG